MNETPLSKVRSLDSAIPTQKWPRAHRRQHLHCCSFPETSSSANPKNNEMPPASMETDSTIEQTSKPSDAYGEKQTAGEFTGTNSANSKVSSMLVRERLKHCVLNKRRSREQESSALSGSNSMDVEVSQKTTAFNQTTLKLGKASENSSLEVWSKSTTSTIKNLADIHSSAIQPDSRVTSFSLPSTNLSMDIIQSPVTYRSLQTQYMTRSPRYQILLPHIVKSTTSQRPSGDRLRKTMSEPSLKLRCTSSNQRFRSRGDRRSGHSTLTTAVAAAAVVAANSGLNSPGDHLASHPLAYKVLQRQSQIGKPQHSLQVAMDTANETTGVETTNDVETSSSSIPETGLPPGVVNAFSSVRNELGSDSHHILSAKDGDYRASLPNLANPQSLNLHPKPASTTALTALSSSRLGCLSTNDTDRTAEPLLFNPFGSDAEAYQNALLGGIPTTARPSMKAASRSKPISHVLPRQHHSLGLISRTRSAPLGLSGGTPQHGLGLIGNGSVSGGFARWMPSFLAGNSSTSVANVLAMEAAASVGMNGNHDRRNPNSASSGNFDEHAPVNIGVVATTTSEDQEQQRSRVVQQLRRKLLERSENLTSDRSEFGHHPALANHGGNLFLERTTSSPSVNLTVPAHVKLVSNPSFTTVLAYDLGMLAHHCTCQSDANHPENPRRLISIWQRLQTLLQDADGPGILPQLFSMALHLGGPFLFADRLTCLMSFHYRLVFS